MSFGDILQAQTVWVQGIILNLQSCTVLKTGKSSLSEPKKRSVKFRKHEESVTEYGSRLMCEATLGKMNIGMFVCKDLSGSAKCQCQDICFQ